MADLARVWITLVSALVVVGAVIPAAARGVSAVVEARSETSPAQNGDPADGRDGDGNGGWEQTREENGIRVFKRDLPDSKLLSFKAVGIVDAPIDLVLSVLLDPDRFSEWAGAGTSSRVVGWFNKPVDYVSHDRIDLPWPVKDRDFVTRVTIEVDSNDSTTEVSYGASDHSVPSSSDSVRGSLVGSSYLLEPIDGGRRTRATGVAVADPRGAVPAWLVNFYQRNWPYDTLMAVREQAAKPDVVVLPRLRPLYTSLRERID